MESKDLSYIFSNVDIDKKTEYPSRINIGTRSIQLNYLKKSGKNYKERIVGNKKYIDILRKDFSVIATVSQNVYPTNSRAGIKLGMSKVDTENHLNNCNIRTPKSKTYSPEDVEIAYNETFINTDNNVVIKPSHSTLGKGVVVDVNKEGFFDAWSYAKLVKSKGKEIIVQEYLPGFEARATVIQGRLHSIVLRIPPYVVGNGHDSLDILINKKNKQRKTHSHLSKAPIVKNNRILSYLKTNNLDLSYIPNNNEFVLLVSVSNFSLGGELMDITNLVSENIKKTALKALASMPGMFTGGLDIIMRSFDDEDPVILEVNSYPALSLALYPTYGRLDNPFKNYVESIISIDQFVNPVADMYVIEGADEYIRDILKFNQLKNSIDFQRKDFK